MVENCLAGYNSCMFAYGQVFNALKLLLTLNMIYGVDWGILMCSYLFLKQSCIKTTLAIVTDGKW